MEQGRIDRILSSRPEDRREVFEEASGITKFKADKREAMRKLEQTEPTCCGWPTSSARSSGRSSRCSARRARPGGTRISQRIAAFEAEAETFTRELQRRRSAQMEQEKLAIRLQQELEETDQRQRGAHQRRARLEVEQAEAARRVEQAETQAAAMDERIRAAVDRAAALREDCRLMRADAETRARRGAEARDRTAAVQATIAALDAQLDMLARQEQAAEGFAGGARWLLAPERKAGAGAPGRILGALADLVRTDPAHEACLQAALRPWLDAVVVDSPAAARAWLLALDAARAGSARLLASDAAAGPAAGGPGEPLVDHVTCAPEARAAIGRLLAPVRVVPSLDALPEPLPEGLIFVTPAGQLASGRGVFEYWMAGAEEQNPLARGQLRDELRRRRAGAEAGLAEAARTLDTLQAGEREQTQALAARSAELDEAAREEASLSGERRRIGQDLEQTRRRLETVADEIETLARGGAEDLDARARLAAAIEEGRARTIELHAQVQESVARQPDIEEARRRLSEEASDIRIDAAGRRRDVEELVRRLDIQRQRIGELEGLIADRERGAAGYRARIEELVRAMADAGDQVEPLERERALHQTRLDALRREREELARGIEQLDQALRTRRAALDEARGERAQLDVTLAQRQMRLQALAERARADYRATPEDVRAAVEPDWGEEGAPGDLDTLEGRIADLRARLDSMGPVNLVAIEEYQEHEQRHDFLVVQQNDLVAAKDQLVEMIRTINQTTLQLFSETFTKVNENFRGMFTKLFGGGTAHLVLVDEGDVLESGIEIVARPPGKKPTTVSLLSGGERTMTAVALLFALYMVKPSPFCVLDELDAALDDSNIGRFVSIVQGFLEKSQFIVITHNRQTIAASNVLYGVTMEKSGISKMVSVRFNTEGRVEHGREAMAEPETTAAPDAATPAEPEPVG
jgi:chromosome segregation protein